METQSKPIGLPEEKIARMIELEAIRHAEDIEYWRNATEEERGETLYQLLKLASAIDHFEENNPPSRKQ